MKSEQILDPNDCVGLKFKAFIPGFGRISVILFEDNKFLAVKSVDLGDSVEAPEVVNTRVDAVKHELYSADLAKYGLV